MEEEEQTVKEVRSEKEGAEEEQNEEEVRSEQ